MPKEIIPVVVKEFHMIKEDGWFMIVAETIQAELSMGEKWKIKFKTKGNYEILKMNVQEFSLK